MEKWNAYTKDGRITDTELIRGEPIPKGLYHLVCEVLVRHEDGSYLCMKRSMEKPNYPGYYEATAGGSALMGEDKLQCVRRELFEETGIIGDRFEEVGYTIDEENQCLMHSFVCCVNCDKRAIRLQAGETEDYKWMTEAEFIEFLHSGRTIDSQMKRFSNYYHEMQYVG